MRDLTMLITVGFYTRSLALVADAFHYISVKKDSPQSLSFGWQRSRLLGAFFNGVFLLALGVSIFLQSIERFVSVENHGHSHGDSNDHSHDHEHSHSHSTENGTELVFAFHDNHRHNNHEASKKGYDLGMLGVLIHVIGDAANNVGVIISALVIWLTSYSGRYYADPAVSMAISFVILTTSIPLVKNSGKILLESAPSGIDLGDVKHDLETVRSTCLIDADTELKLGMISRSRVFSLSTNSTSGA
ncbi:unnamed protein product [Penicillium olsonii]|nr:unnamed protein product [Penicillium olsonii]CAG7933158.1 unnamed protein product [Penicillium olsonii]